jgi:hypothetical protein
VAELVYMDDDLVKATVGPRRTIVLAFGDPIEIVGPAGDAVEIRVHDRGAHFIKATISKKARTRAQPLLHFSMIDVQQGDGMIIETPRRRRLFIDGGDNQLFARFCAARYPGTTAEAPLPVDAMIVSHGDADHFGGLKDIVESEKEKGDRARKRLFIHPHRIFHNGLVKGPTTKNGKSVPDAEMFGPSATIESKAFATDLVHDLREVPAERLNAPFKGWLKAIRHWSARGPIDIRRLAFGDEAAFGFLADEGIRVEVHGPLVQRKRVDGRMTDVLEILKTPQNQHVTATSPMRDLDHGTLSSQFRHRKLPEAHDFHFLAEFYQDLPDPDLNRASADLPDQ